MTLLEGAFALLAVDPQFGSGEVVLRMGNGGGGRGSDNMVGYGVEELSGPRAEDGNGGYYIGAKSS